MENVLKINAGIACSDRANEGEPRPNEGANNIFMYMCATKVEYEGVENETWLWNVQLKNTYNKVKKGGAK
ncbi:MAG: hypothetical protein LBG80_09145 [Bacteroidales bacterium]|jgi:hypothetical protein|nr:hypothetical protein [Bacteroidales bacterium]